MHSQVFPTRSLGRRVGRDIVDSHRRPMLLVGTVLPSLLLHPPSVTSSYLLSCVLPHVICATQWDVLYAIFVTFRALLRSVDSNSSAFVPCTLLTPLTTAPSCSVSSWSLFSSRALPVPRQGRVPRRRMLRGGGALEPKLRNQMLRCLPQTTAPKIETRQRRTSQTQRIQLHSCHNQ